MIYMKLKLYLMIIIFKNVRINFINKIIILIVRDWKKMLNTDSWLKSSKSIIILFDCCA